MKKKLLKGVSVYLALSLLFQIISPTVAFALTSGPSQPELESFEPVGTTEMVDPFSGDFNYNIPLMTVPGPNGGYPINMAYHSGIGMEQEASWVGLGWNINAGEINREMRGLPDDFNGDKVTKKMYMKNNQTISIESRTSVELLNMDAHKGINLGFTSGITWNSYKGIGLTTGSSVSNSHGDASGFIGGVKTNYNSLSGSYDLSPSLSYNKMTNTRATSFSLGITRSSAGGWKDLSLDMKTSKVVEKKMVADKRKLKKARTDQEVYDSFHEQNVYGYPIGAGASYSGSSFIPHADMPMGGFSVGTQFEFGADIWGVNAYFGGSAFYSQNKISENSIDFKAYGYLYSQNRKWNHDDQKYALMDFNREKDAMLTKDIPDMPSPVFTNDIYVVKGQGVGGVFRPYRSDIGILQDPKIRSTNYGGDLGVEIAIGDPFKVGADVSLSASIGYSGPWRHMEETWSQFEGSYEFKGEDISSPLYEPFYFRNTGDMTSDFTDESSRFNNTSNLPFPINLRLTLPSVSDMTSFNLDEMTAPFVDVKVTNNNELTYNKRSYRQSRSQLMSYKMVRQMKNPNYGLPWTKNIYGERHGVDQYPHNGTARSYDYSTLTGKDDHIGEISITNVDGNKYIYAIPAYNNSQTEVSFSVSPMGSSDNALDSGDKLVNYTNADNSPGNNKNIENLYTSKSIDKYAHSYLLTAIISPDYVDLTGDGPTDDDYGYFVKFNYKLQNTDYHWRAPYNKASYIRGAYSDDNDDIGGYTYGTKDIWYLNSIETKTHVAEFKLSPRNDGYGASSENNGISGGIVYDASQKLMKLDQIDLYSKSDPNYSTAPTPIKTVHFTYTYDLCGNVINNSYYNPSVGDFGTAPANSGKLTLKSVWFTYMNNQKGSLSPYVFDYHETNSDENPNFSTMKVDRWGNYKKDYNEETPYVDQKQDLNGDLVIDQNDNLVRDKLASVWNLKRIVLPSGGEIKVDYESDDYAYVQDKAAMQMSKIKGIGRKKIDGTFVILNKLNMDNDLVFFEMEKPGFTSDDVWNCVKDLKQVYFKAYEKLKHKYVGGAFAYDYVDGYAEVENLSYGDNGDYGVKDFGTGERYGYVKLKKISIQDNPLIGSGTQTHPFKKAGWQYMKLNRPDLLYPTPSTTTSPSVPFLTSQIGAVLGFVTSQIQMYIGYYNYCDIRGYCNEIIIDDYHPSFIRTTTPDGIKYGGGHRVKRLVINDTWEGGTLNGENVSEYGKEYIYRLKDGTSSGVAEYEPIIGGEEIPHRMPIRYSSPYFICKNKNLYLEEPLCESYYPAANVGYSRVVVKAIAHVDDPSAATPTIIPTTRSETGITEYEFYTSKDFPIIVTPSNLLHKKFRPPHINVPFIGGVGFDNNGFSQSYTVETNNMHGKEKSVTTYNHDADLFNSITAPFITKTEYKYKTDPANAHHLDNLVDVLYDDAYYKKSELGLTKEFFMDMRETSSSSFVTGAQANLEIFYAYPVPNVLVVPAFDYSEALFKSMVAMNVVSRNGILVETIQNSEGSIVSSKNLMFDAETGKPLLTTVKNDFHEPIYSYEYAAHWAYAGMGSGYKNAGATFDFKSNGSGNFEITNASDYFNIGDEVNIENLGLGSSGDYYPIFTVTAINNNYEVVLKGRQSPGSPNVISPPINKISSFQNTWKLSIVRSGKRNQQSVSNGSIVSLSNPLTKRDFPLFKAWNDYYDSHSGTKPPSFNGKYTFTDCASGSEIDFGVSYTLGRIHFSLYNGCTDGIDVYLPNIPTTANYKLQKAGTHVYAVFADGTQLLGSMDDPGGCLKECLPGVLNANAAEYQDKWSNNANIEGLETVAEDVNNNNYSVNAIPSASDVTTNPFLYGGVGIWRNWKSHVYQVKREQNTPTDISKDGTYKKFVLFDWAHPNNNTDWTKTMQVTKYSPYGYELENEDALNIKSSAIYGYNNSLVTAIASNCAYSEIAFDGFEDYPLGVYPVSGIAKGHGHINLAATMGTYSSLVSTYSHTGKYSMEIEDGQMVFNTSSSALTNFIPVIGKEYILSAWVKSGVTPSISVSNSTYVPLNCSAPIEGWRKCELRFTPNSTSVEITFGAGGPALFWIDDIRIQPFKSIIKTYVYDPQKLWLLSELDNQNYATFYNYDEEGSLIQVKKETVKGIVTLKSTRSNVKY